METTEKEKPTRGPWTWTIEDYSSATLHGPDYYEDHVLSASLCDSCQKHHKKEGEWKWGRCTTPSLANAELIASAPETAERLEQAEKDLEELEKERSEWEAQCVQSGGELDEAQKKLEQAEKEIERLEEEVQVANTSLDIVLGVLRKARAINHDNVARMMGADQINQEIDAVLAEQTKP